jgi:hypothetical protein
LKGQTLSKGLDVGHIQIQTTFYKVRVKKMLSFLASSTFFKYARNEGFAFKKFKIFMAYPQTPSACSDRFTVLTGDTWVPTFTPGLPDF